MKEDIFVTGTDTNVGKTVLSALLVAALDAVYWKPIQSGACEGTDRASVMRWADVPAARAAPECYCLDLAVSPHLAAAAENVTIDLARVVRPSGNGSAAPAGPLVVEGAGGVLVPINDTQTILDLIRHLAMPVIVAARSALGTINHTTLTVHELRRAGVTVKGVVLIGAENRDNERSIERYAAVPIVGRIPWLDRIHKKALLEIFGTQFDRRCFR